MNLELHGEAFILSPHKVIFRKKTKTLLLADLHLTKEAHFRKHGIAVPARITAATLQILDEVISEFSPQKILFLGDLFHSKENKGIQEFINWRSKYVSLSFSLIHGNHDILETHFYDEMKIELEGILREEKHFLFTHEPIPNSSKINFCGHIHPAAIIKGKAKQHLRLPCFYFSKNNFILPAFGKFTGTHAIKRKKDDQLFIIADEEIIKI